MLSYERPKPREAEHLTLRVVGLYQPVAVEQCCLALLEHYLVLLVAHPRHDPQGHAPGPQLLAFASTAPKHIGQVVAGVGVADASALGIEYAIEAGNEHVGGDAGKQCLIDPREH